MNIKNITINNSNVTNADNINSLTNIINNGKEKNKNSKYETPIFILNADLAAYSDATKNDKELYEKIQSFWIDRKNEIDKIEECELSKLEGDCIKIFFRKDGTKLLHIANDLINKFKINFSNLNGLRIVIGYGLCFKEEKEGIIDFAGESIIETVRIDAPMKKYIKKNNENNNQIWITESAKNKIIEKPNNLNFQPILLDELDKGYATDITVFKIEQQ